MPRGSHKYQAYRAVCDDGHREYYTGEPLDWRLLGFLIRWSALEHFENFPVRAGKSQLAQFEPRTPAFILKPRGRPVGEFNAIDLHRDPVARDPVPHSTEWFNGEWTRAEKIFRELPTLGSAPGQFDIWEFPEMGVDHAGRTPANEEASLSLDDEGRKSALS